MKRTNLLAVAAAGLISLSGLLVGYFIFTNNGSTLITKLILSKYSRAKSVNIKKSQGSLARTLVLQDIEIEDAKAFQRGSSVRIQRLEVYFKSPDLRGAGIEVHNGRLQLPASELVVFQGVLKNSILDGNVYSKSLSAEGLAGFFPGIKELKGISGSINGIDIYVKATLSEPEFSGECQIEKLIRNGFSLLKSPVRFNLRLKDPDKKPGLNGEIFLNSGIILGPKTARIVLGESKISFSGSSKEVFLDVKGASNVEGVKITIVLKGTLDKPELKLTSDPSLPQERLLVMLITGKSWKATETALIKGRFSADLVKDFVDYFVFSGSGSELARQLGISDISVTLEKQTKGVGVKKAITEKIDISYTVQQSQIKEEAPAITQKVGGEFKITEGISIGAEKELKQGDKPEEPLEEKKADDKVTIEFKKAF